MGPFELVDAIGVLVALACDVLRVRLVGGGPLGCEGGVRGLIPLSQAGRVIVALA